MGLNMLNAYYSKGASSSDIFDKLKISNDPTYQTHLNKHNVIYFNALGFLIILKKKKILLITSIIKY